MRFAVVGHTEWVQFARVERLPAPGEVVHATDAWEEAAAAAPAIAAQLARLGADVELHTALGDDEPGRRAAAQFDRQGLAARIQWRSEPTRRAFAHVDADGERTITVLGPKLVPRGPLDLDVDACFLVAGDVAAVRSARAARFLAATAREVATLRQAGVPVELLVGSANDPDERVDGVADAGHVVLTEGARGGVADGRRFAAAPPPGPVADGYGCGDAFAAALAFALARGDELDAAVELAARAGAAVLTGRGPFAAQITA